MSNKYICELVAPDFEVEQMPTPQRYIHARSTKAAAEVYVMMDCHKRLFRYKKGTIQVRVKDDYDDPGRLYEVNIDVTGKLLKKGK